MPVLPTTPNILPTESIFSDGDSYFNALIQDIQAAVNSIDLETYIYEDDALGRRVAIALSQAAARGVAIRILVDGCGTLAWGGQTKAILENAHIPSRVFNPLPWHQDTSDHPLKHHPLVAKILFGLFNLNARNHRKVCIIDQEIAYVGSLNISECHISTGSSGGWRDTAVRLTGLDFQELTEAFEAVWQQSEEPSRMQKTLSRLLISSPKKEPIIRLNNTRYNRRILYKRMLFRLSRCRHRIWITSAYFVPDNFVLKRLTKAAKAGLDVRILLPKISDLPFMTWVSAEFYPQLLKSGVRIFQYHPSILHAKLLILDDWIMIGSSNLNHRSLFHDLEVDVQIQQESSKTTIIKQFLKDIENSTEVTSKDLKKRPFYQRVLGKIILYLKYWI